MSRSCPPEIIPPEQREWASAERALLLAARLKPAKSQCKRGLVYFIRCASGPVKIGRAVNAEQRVAELQTGNPHELTIAATVAGGLVAERSYHERFAEHRIRGEWFDPHPDILAEIERINHLAPKE